MPGDYGKQVHSYGTITNRLVNTFKIRYNPTTSAPLKVVQSYIPFSNCERQVVYGDIVMKNLKTTVESRE
jgi:hypothetical protein